MNIIITGASRGIGYELVKQLSADAGNTVFAVARDQKRLQQLKKECESLNPLSVVIPCVCDLNDSISVQELLNRLKEQKALIHYLVNNAGAILNKPFLDISSKEMEYVYQVNVFSAARLIQGVIPLLDPDKRAHILNISSIGGFQGSSKFAGLSAYSSSKAALACLTECLAEEFKESNIAFNCLALGAVQTEMLESAFPGYKAPLSAGQMAVYISDFLLNAHNFMNGKIIPVSLSTP